ncbi:tetratricopeptide repeat protein [Azospirillum sp. TSO22-1]|uniref:tetratricopeptide repeat protein n=1 Tax=Azospirillum sp. TSO22-1 TaxID=716789 RepID=UPI000D6084D2|nr:tetratricopeptide repeat protein [Azospirillum sp. TSO22-1]PWC40165.1 hypothetical protein TSO221_25655 [Azospirillum sp. TSO22-1]
MAAGNIITFYSYKGGTGRSMTLANIACLLLKQGKSVLAIDWDLEAPGLHRFFAPLLKPEMAEEARLNQFPGIIDLFEYLDDIVPQEGNPENWKAAEGSVANLPLHEYFLPAETPGLHLIKAGRFDDSYPSRIARFDWEGLFNRSPYLFHAFGRRLASQFDYVLIDSRTGLTDTSGICTMLMPDKLVVVFTTNRQSLLGIQRMVERVIDYRITSGDPRPLGVFPLPSRIEPTHPDLKKQWRFEAEGVAFQPLFEELFKKIYDLEMCDLTDYFNQVQIPHVPYYAYGETIAVRDEHPDRLSMTSAYEDFLERLIVQFAASDDLETARRENARVATRERLEALFAGLNEGEPERVLDLFLTLIELSDENKIQGVPRPMDYFSSGDEQGWVDRLLQTGALRQDAGTITIADEALCDDFVPLLRHVKERWNLLENRRRTRFEKLAQLRRSELSTASHDVYLSCSHTDEAEIAPVLEALRRRGVSVFLNRQDFQDEAGIATRLNEALGTSKILVAWYSRHYAISRNRQWELTAACLAGAAEGSVSSRVVVINPEGDDAHILPPELRDSHLLRKDDVEATSRWIAERAAAVSAPLGAVVPLTGGKWHGPRRLSSSRFVGRSVEMWRLHGILRGRSAALLGDSRARTVMVQGLGGIGKSLLAEEYALRFSMAYPGGIFWLNAAGDDFARQVVDVAMHLDLPVADLPVERVRGLLEQHLLGLGPYLWIVDDLLSTANGDEFVKWLAPTANGSTLITTRGSKFEGTFSTLSLNTLSPDEALALLTRKHPPRTDGERRHAEEIARMLGNHALALDVAGSAVALMGYSDFLEQLGDQSADVLDLAAEISLIDGHESSIAATLLRSVERLEPSGLQVLQLASLIAAEPIPNELIFAVFARLETDERRGRRQALRALAAVERESLGQFAANLGLRVHSLVSRAVRYRFPPVPALRAAAVEVLNTVLQRVEDARAHAGLTDWLPHARALCEQAEDAATITLVGLVGRYDFERGDYRAARAGWERQLEARRRILGEEHPHTLAAMNNLAVTLSRLGDLSAARALDERVLSVRLRVLGDEHPETLASLRNLASTLSLQGDLNGARMIQEKALAVSRRTLGEEHPDTLVSLNNLASILSQQGDLSGAQLAQEQVLSIRRRTLGDEHPDTLISTSNLASTLSYKGDFRAAMALQESAFYMCRKVLGEEHPYTLAIMHNLAATLRHQGYLDRARELLEEAVHICRTSLGGEHPDTLVFLSNLASTLREQGDFSEALALQEEVLAQRRQTLGDEHLDTLSTMANLAITLRQQGDLGQARDLAATALKISEKTGTEYQNSVSLRRLLEMMSDAESDSADPGMDVTVIQQKALE